MWVTERNSTTSTSVFTTIEVVCRLLTKALNEKALAWKVRHSEACVHMYRYLYDKESVDLRSEIGRIQKNYSHPSTDNLYVLVFRL